MSALKPLPGAAVSLSPRLAHVGVITPGASPAALPVAGWATTASTAHNRYALVRRRSLPKIRCPALTAGTGGKYSRLQVCLLRPPHAILGDASAVTVRRCLARHPVSSVGFASRILLGDQSSGAAPEKCGEELTRSHRCPMRRRPGGRARDRWRRTDVGAGSPRRGGLCARPSRAGRVPGTLAGAPTGARRAPLRGPGRAPMRHSSRMGPRGRTPCAPTRAGLRPDGGPPGPRSSLPHVPGAPRASRVRGNGGPNLLTAIDE